MNKEYILDNKIEEEHNKYLFEIEKGEFIHVKELLLAFESLQKQLEDLVKQLKEAYKEKDRLNNIIKEVREYIKHYETIRGYYEYQELGYDEYNYDEDLKQELLEILDKENI